jgi:hypothetical protein
MTTFILTASLLSALMQTPNAARCKPALAPFVAARFYSSAYADVFIEDQAGTWNGGGWIGWSHESTSLRPLRLSVHRIPNTPEGDSPEVSVQRTALVDFAVRCLPAVRAGTLMLGLRTSNNRPVRNQELDSDGPLGISLGNRTYEVRLQSTDASLADAKVVLSGDGRTQVLYSMEEPPDDPHFKVVWTGDLDGDRKLDLLVIFSRKYTEHSYQLLLSSKASKGQLVGHAVTFEHGD